MEERKLLIGFEKQGDIRFISHLDMARVFIRALRRAKVPLKYSEGFHAHPKISFSLPLSVGTESRCESCRLTLAQGCELSVRTVLSRLQKNLPAGFVLTEGSEYVQKPALPTHTAYSLMLGGKQEQWEEVRAALSRPLPVQKRTKSGEKTIELSALLSDITLTARGDTARLLVTLPAGESLTVNPSLLLDALNARGFDLTLLRAVRERCITR